MEKLSGVHKRNNVYMGRDLPRDFEAVEYIAKHGDFPFELMDYQKEVVASLANLSRSGMFPDVGTGKTAMSVALAKIRRERFGNRTLIILPPILRYQWEKALRGFGETDITVYDGVPKKRHAKNLKAQWVIVGIEIFKKDFMLIYEAFRDDNVTVIVDEAVSVKNVTSENHRSLRDFLDGNISNASERRKNAVKRAETRAQAKKAGMSAKQFEAAKKDESVNVKLATLKNLIKKGR